MLDWSYTQTHTYTFKRGDKDGVCKSRSLIQFRKYEWKFRANTKGKQGSAKATAFNGIALYEQAQVANTIFDQTTVVE